MIVIFPLQEMKLVQVIDAKKPKQGRQRPAVYYTLHPHEAEASEQRG
jgi:hypothetical protein